MKTLIPLFALALLLTACAGGGGGAGSNEPVAQRGTAPGAPAVEPDVDGQCLRLSCGRFWIHDMGADRVFELARLVRTNAWHSAPNASPNALIALRSAEFAELLAKVIGTRPALLEARELTGYIWLAERFIDDLGQVRIDVDPRPISDQIARWIAQ